VGDEEPCGGTGDEDSLAGSFAEDSGFLQSPRQEVAGERSLNERPASGIF